MGAVGAGADRDLGMAVEQERDIAALNDGRDGFGAVDQRALVACLEAKQNGGDVAGVQRRAEVARKGAGIAELRRDQIKPRGGRADVISPRIRSS